MTAFNWTWSFHVLVLQRTAKKRSKIYNARAQPLLYPLHLLFGDVLVSIVVVVCLSSLIPQWWGRFKEIRVASLIGSKLRAKIQNRETSNQRRYTDLCRATSSARNYSGPVSSVFPAREDPRPRSESSLCSGPCGLLVILSAAVKQTESSAKFETLNRRA